MHLTKHLTAVIIILFGRGGRVVKIKMFNNMFQKHWYIIFTTNDFFSDIKKRIRKINFDFSFFDLDCIHNIVLVVTLDLSNKYLPTSTRYSFGHLSWNWLNLHSRNQKAHHCRLIYDKKSNVFLFLKIVL